MWYNNLSGKGSDNLMDNVKDYLEKLEIKNSRLEKQLKEVQVSKVVYFKEDRIVYMYLLSKEMISHEILDLLKEELLGKLKYFKNIRIKIKFTGFGRKSEKDIQPEWSVYYAGDQVPAQLHRTEYHKR